MATLEVELLTDQGNFAVVQLPGRKYPGVIVQGDTLSILIATTSEAMEALEHRDTGEAQELLRDLAEHLQAARERYEAALRARGTQLPY